MAARSDGLNKIQWAQWLGATFIAGLTLVASQTTYLHTTFAKLSHIEELKADRQRDINLIRDDIKNLRDDIKTLDRKITDLGR